MAIPNAQTRDAFLFEEMNRKEPIILGVRDDGSDLTIRFRAALLTPWVRIHVQDEADGSAYDPDNFDVGLSELRDCRTNRVQDFVIPSAAYTVYLIPVQKDGAGTLIYYDGEDGRPDAMAFMASVEVP